MQKSIIAMGATALLTCGITSCNSANEESDQNIIEATDFKSEDGIFSIEAMEALGRVNAPVISPDSKQILFGIGYESVQQNKSNTDLYVADINGENMHRITKTAKSESGYAWIEDGQRIAYLYPDKEGKPQVWVMDTDGKNSKQITSVEKGVEGFLFSPDGNKILLIGTVKYSRSASDLYPDLPDATGKIIDDLMYKHWDEWVTEIPHPFIGSYDGEQVTDIKDIMIDEPYEAPMRPFGGIESFAWTPDSKSVVYVSRKKTGKDYALSTNSDLYLYDIAEETTRNLTEGMMGYDTNPYFSPDGKYLAWLSMEHDGYESDKNRLFVMDWQTGVKTDLTEEWDYTVDQFVWRPDSKGLFFIAYYQGGAPVFNIDVESKQVATVDEGQYDYASLAAVDNNSVLALRHSMVRANEIYMVSTEAEPKAITDINGSIFDQLKMPEVKAHWVETTNGEKMLTWVVLPPDFDENAVAKYPAILYCQGGPQSAVSQFWSYRWNLALMASHGYVVIAPNRHGLPGFGQAWLEQISKDYPGQNMQDYLTAVDYAKANIPAIDGTRIGATGASYGGFSIYYLAGIHNHRFAALLAHAGIFNLEAQYLETEEMFFANWDLGGAFWEKDNAAAQRTYANSPHKLVDKWDTPIMISHGELDYRILASQGMAAFNAAKLRGVPAEMVIFPDENHWILKPQNAVLWQRLFFRWFDKWLKK
ncbi:MAG: S9 family peptidase [Muribaculaceae bacterium]|nr:S9 family peptidase [Muribaculaceae bacterium]